MVGSGPNGLSAAAVLAQAGYSVLVLEAAEELGGGVKTLPLTVPGFAHDVCSSIFPLAVSSPAFRAMPLESFGLEWVHPEAPLAHPLEGGRAVVLERSLEATARSLEEDADAYRKLLGTTAENWDRLIGIMMGQSGSLKTPGGLFRFGAWSTRSQTRLIETFRAEPARALLTGIAAHANLPMTASLSAGFGLLLAASGHGAGWPFPRGGAGKLAAALVGYLKKFGVALQTGSRVNSVDELPKSRLVLCDLSPRELLRIAGHRFPEGFRRKLAGYTYGPGAFKMDWALDAPIPWEAPSCRRAGTVHLGGSAEEILASEEAVQQGKIPERPFVIAAQHSLFDSSRAPEGKHTAWGYCHVPNGSNTDMADRIETQIERFAPGFRDRILRRSVRDPTLLEADNPNFVGGDIGCGLHSVRQMIARPSWRGYLTPDPSILICSAATLPGTGVHGMCGYFAAQFARLRLRSK
ncbi:phytoene desaturase family protein [Terriglobus albidus]|uniref:phytoene desaturase family protein n=1 Tax=Terriglobus albidus TaxID=1592106 RepID=UPI0021DFE465|nr:NAD(P)/FAD-dependent oxidoreductase [Terriglobus albidus]